MDVKIKQLLARYEARWDEEQKLQESISQEEAVARIDEFLLPVGPDTGALMSILVKSQSAPTILEVGASHGYSTIWLAEAAQATGGKVISLELSAKKVDYAGKALEEVGLRDFVEFRIGDAIESIAQLPGPFDFVLIDLWKDLYIPTFDGIYPKLSRGAMIAADNIVYPPFNRDNARAYRAHVRKHAEIESVLLPVGAGIELTRFGGGL